MSKLPHNEKAQTEEDKLLLSHPLDVTNKQHLLQKIAKVIAMISLLIAATASGYLFMIDDTDKVLKASVGAIAFFCFTVGLVLKAIAAANLPNLKLSSNTAFKTKTNNK